MGKIKRKKPKPDVLRELYLLSGNNCAMPDCQNAIIDSAGVAIGHVCHIEAALPGGARFNPDQNEEQRRSVENLILLCAGHHTVVDDKKHRSKWTVETLKEIKRTHEDKFRSLDNSLEIAFQNAFLDNTDNLNPTQVESFSKFERLLPHCKIDGAEASKRKKQINDYVEKLSLVSDKERQFMLAVIKRALKLKLESISVSVDDVNSSLSISHSKIKNMGEALVRYEMGCVDEVGTMDGNFYHVMIAEPSDFVMWFDIDEFCKLAKCTLEDFVIELNFGILN